MRFVCAICLVLANSVVPGALAQTVVAHGDGAEAVREASKLRVTALTDSILRVRIARNGEFGEAASWAVPASARAKHVAAIPAGDGFTTHALQVRIDSVSLRLTVEDLAGKVITTDAADPLTLDGPAFTLRKAMPDGERYYGLGARAITVTR